MKPICSSFKAPSFIVATAKLPNEIHGRLALHELRHRILPVERGVVLEGNNRLDQFAPLLEHASPSHRCRALAGGEVHRKTRSR